MSRARVATKCTAATDPAHIGKSFTGKRKSWAAVTIVKHGTKGVRRVDHAATSLPHYVWFLRQEFGEGIISTTYEKHGPPFEGNHARYRITDPLMRFEVNEIKPAKKTKPALVKRASNPKSKDGQSEDLSDE